jgi:hypothetical protein
MTILDLYKKNEKDLYGGPVGASFIDTRGIINAPRAAALAGSSPTTLADLIGNQVAGIMKGSANRPSDTIFRSNQPFAKPVTLSALPQNAINGDTKYFVKRNAAPYSIFAKLAQGASSPAGLATKIAVEAIKNPNVFKKKIKDLTTTMKNAVSGQINGFGTQNSPATELTPDGWVDSRVLKQDQKFSDYAPVYSRDSLSGKFKRTSVIVRDKKNTIDNLLSSILDGSKDATGNKFLIESKNGIQMPYVLISLYPNQTNKILLPATVSGLSEKLTPELSSFKYLGSPFNSYKYTGVERSISFNLQLYYTDDYTKGVMIKNLNKIRKLAYPAEKLAKIGYVNSKENNSESDYFSAIAYSPNLIYMTIFGFYKELFGIIDDISIDVDDNTAWPITDVGFNGDSIAQPHPSVINVSLSMKCLETPIVWANGNDSEYEYSGDDSTYFNSNNADDRTKNASDRQKFLTNQSSIQSTRDVNQFDAAINPNA